jgi:hypothetical protein
MWTTYSPEFRIEAAFLTRCRFDNIKELSFNQCEWDDEDSGHDGHVELQHLLSCLPRLEILKPCIELVDTLLPYIGPSVHTVDLTEWSFPHIHADAPSSRLSCAISLCPCPLQVLTLDGNL